MVPIWNASWLWDERATGDFRLRLCTFPPSAVASSSSSATSTGPPEALSAGQRPCTSGQEPALSSNRPSHVILGHKRRANDGLGEECDPGASIASGTAESPIEQQATAPSMQEVAHMLHSIIIASASEYFKAHLPTGVGKEGAGSSEVSAGPKYDLKEEVDPDQVEAAGAVLELMYKHRLPAGISVGMMLSMLQVSDRWIAPGCVGFIQTALTSLPPSSFTLRDATAFFRLCEELRHSVGLAPVLETAGAILHEKFGDVVSVLGSASLTEQALQLPQPALLYLLESDALVTDYEDCVLVLVSWWLEDEVGRHCSEREVKELQGAIRYIRLSSTYLAQVLHQLPKLRPTEVQLLQLLEYKTLEPAKAIKYISSLGLMAAGRLKPARTSPSTSRNCIDILLDVPGAQLEAHITALRAPTANTRSLRCLATSSRTQGTRFTVSLLFFSNSRTDQFRLSVELYVPLPRSGGRMDLPRGAVCNISVSLQGETGELATPPPASLFVSSGGVSIPRFPRVRFRPQGDPLGLSMPERVLLADGFTLAATVTLP